MDVKKIVIVITAALVLTACNGKDDVAATDPSRTAVSSAPASPEATMQTPEPVDSPDPAPSCVRYPNHDEVWAAATQSVRKADTDTADYSQRQIRSMTFKFKICANNGVTVVAEITTQDPGDSQANTVVREIYMTYFPASDQWKYNPND